MSSFSTKLEGETRLNNQNEIVKGTISIGASNIPGAYILPKILGEFKEMNPYANTSLHIANTSEVEKMVFENAVDFAVVEEEVIRNSTLCAEKIMEDEIVFIASPGGEFSEKPYVEAKDLKNIKYISHEKDSKRQHLHDFGQYRCDKAGCCSRPGHIYSTQVSHKNRVRF